MKPQEKAKELVDKYYKLAESIEWTDKETSVKAEKFNDELGTDVLRYWNELAKQSALLAVNEIFDIGLLGGDYRNEQSTIDDFSTVTWYFNYWEEVKHEIEQL